MDTKALLVAASADPVIEVNQQKLETDALGKKVLSGQLVNQSGQIVNIPHVIAAYYDNNGKVIWVSDGYVAQALLPQVPVSFAVDVSPGHRQERPHLSSSCQPLRHEPDHENAITVI